MKATFLRPALLIALALGLSGCGGGKTTYPVRVNMVKSSTIEGLVYAPLVLKESVSGQTLTITDTVQTQFSFPNTIEYGDEYLVEVATQPAHQTCQLGSARDTAGRRATIDVVVACTVNRFNIAGTIAIEAGRTGNIAGLLLINGSDSPPVTVGATTASYSFNEIKYDTPFSLSILKQPDDGTLCRLVRTDTSGSATINAAGTTASGRMGDANIGVNVVCAKPA